MASVWRTQNLDEKFWEREKQKEIGYPGGRVRLLAKFRRTSGPAGGPPVYARPSLGPWYPAAGAKLALLTIAPAEFALVARGMPPATQPPERRSIPAAASSIRGGAVLMPLGDRWPREMAGGTVTALCLAGILLYGRHAIFSCTPPKLVVGGLDYQFFGNDGYRMPLAKDPEMSSPLDSLLLDHRDVECLMLALRHFITTMADREEAAARADLAEFTAVLDGFVDQYHHEKEEAVLLPYVVRLGLSWEEGPVADVRREHRQERYLIDELRQAVAQVGAWSAEDRRHIARTAQAVVDFEQQHLSKENTALFPRILQQLEPAQLAELRVELGRFDERSRAETQPTRTRLVRLIDRHRLAAKADSEA